MKETFQMDKKKAKDQFHIKELIINYKANLLMDNQNI